MYKNLNPSIFLCRALHRLTFPQYPHISPPTPHSSSFGFLPLTLLHPILLFLRSVNDLLCAVQCACVCEWIRQTSQAVGLPQSCWTLHSHRLQHCTTSAGKQSRQTFLSLSCCLLPTHAFSMPSFLFLSQECCTVNR